ncbi:MAG: hypothetical protein ACREMJ_04250 [Gemmatimonadales bacterium]
MRIVWPYRVLALVCATAIRPYGLTAQSLALGPQLVLGDYREVSSDLHYRGAGFGAALTVSYHKVAADVALAQVDYDPTDDANAVDGFQARQFDARVRYYLTGPVSAELGVMSRTVDVDFAAQEAAAVRVGVRVSQLVDPAVRLVLRGNYLAAAKFSGGGSAPFGVDLGLGVSGDLGRGRVRARVVAEYEFQYFGRHTGEGPDEVSVPIQQVLLRFGVAAAF